MAKMIRQTMFTTGEVDEQVWKRTDVNEYLTAAQSLLNCEVGTTGLVKKRKGTNLLLDVSDRAIQQSRMYEFVDKDGNHYVVLSADQHFYIYNAPTEEVHVVTLSGAQVVTLRGSEVVAHDKSLNFYQDISTPYLATDLNQIDYSQDNDTLILTHPDFPPGRIYIVSYDPVVFAFQYLDIYPLPAFDFNTINYNGFTVDLSVSGSVLTFKFTGVGADPGFNDAWIGGQILGGGSTDLSPVGYAIITAVSYSGAAGGTVTFTATVQIAFLTSGFSTQGSQYSVKQPAWSSTTGDPYDLGYPSKVLFYQNRLWLAATKALNNTIFGSKINAPISFDIGTGRDTDAIVYTIGQNNSGAILWLNGGKQLEIFCQNFEFACPQNQDTALTPSTFSVRQQSSYGSSPTLKPQTYINDSYYATRTGKAIINYHFDGIGLTYTSSNISVPSSHLVKNPRNRALQRGSDTSQDNFIYFLNPNDNTLTAFQFATEYKLAALTPVVFQENVITIDIVTIDNEIYILKYYVLTDVYTIEAFDPDTKIDSEEAAAMDSDGLVTGLDRFDGYTVQVVYNNQDFGQYLVEGGEITVDNPLEIADTITVGFLYDVDIQPMYYFSGSAEAPFMKNVNRIYIDYFQSLNFYVETDPTKPATLIPYQNFFDIQQGLPLMPQTDTAIISPVSGWSRFSTFRIFQASPFDLQILSISYQIEMAVI